MVQPWRSREQRNTAPCERRITFNRFPTTQQLIHIRSDRRGSMSNGVTAPVKPYRHSDPTQNACSLNKRSNNPDEATATPSALPYFERDTTYPTLWSGSPDSAVNSPIRSVRSNIYRHRHTQRGLTKTEDTISIAPPRQRHNAPME